MREIKFRAWDGCQILNDVVPLCNNKDEDPAIIEHHFLTGFRIKSVKAVLEFTGLKDKNNREIYEGDICKLYNNDNTIFEVEYNNFIYWNIEQVYLKENLEIIGNIYENPELLK